MRYAAAATCAVAVLLTACTPPSVEESSPQSPTSSAASSPTSSATSSAPSAAPEAVDPPPRPGEGECHRLTHEEAVAPVAEGRSVACRKRHTSQTYEVGRLDLVRDGHLLAVDSATAQQQVANRCPARLSAHLGGGREALRLSMLEAVWFTPSVGAAAAGADWYRCDVVAVGSDEDLLPLPPRTRGMLAAPSGRGRFGMCGTAEPGTEGFRRVACSVRHSWVAVSTVDLPGGAYPSAAEAGRVMEEPCRSVARARAEDPLDFTWSEERPTREQWRAGRRFGICWVPAG